MFLTPEKRLEAIERPKEVLDLRGLLMHSYHGSKDPNAFLGSDGETLIKRAGHGVEAFIERYLTPIFARTAPIDVVAVLEGGNDLRRAIYPDYKGKRRAEKEKMDPRLQEQLDLLEKGTTRLLQYLGCTVVEVPKVEADDVIAMICHKHRGPVLVHTRDVDLGVLAVLPNVSVMLAEQLVDPDDFITVAAGNSKIQLAPRHITLFKTLVGDSSDEYGGVPGVGPKAWEYLVTTYQDEGLAAIEKAIMDDNKDEVLESGKEYADKVLLKIAEHWESARMCYRLASLHPSWCWMAWGGKLLRPIYHKRLPLASKVIEILSSLGIGGLYEDLKAHLATETLVDANWINDSRRERIYAQISDSPALGFDTEGFDSLCNENFKKANGGKDFVDTLSQVMTGASFTFGRNLQHTCYLPVMHRDTANLDKAELLGVLEKAQKSSKLIIAHNARFEEQLIEREFGLSIPDMEDSMTWTSYFDENLMEGSNTGGGLKALSLQLLRYEQEEYKAVLEKAGAKDMRGVSGEQVLHYGCDDALCAAHLWVLMTFAAGLEQQAAFVEEYDILTGKALNRSFVNGIAIDLEQVKIQSEQDRITVEVGMKRVRELLTTFALECDPEEAKARAVRFLEADRDFLELSTKAKFQGCGSERLKAELSTMVMKWTEAVTYKPYVEVPKPVEFLPTAKQIHQIAVYLGLPADLEVMVLGSTGGKKLMEWMAGLNNLVHNSDIEFDEKVLTFMDRLGAAYAQIAKREGAEYQAFFAFCQEIAQAHAKKVWEGDELNFDSPPQMGQLLYLKLGLPVRVRSKVQGGSDRNKWKLQGSPATNEKAMQMAIAEDCPEGDWRREVLKTIIEVKGALTRAELFWGPYPLWIHPKDGRVHGSIKNNGTVTRRPTGSQPNLLQVSKGPVRRMVVPLPYNVRILKYNRHVVVSIDFSGQELRITGSEANDPAFVEAYTGGGTYQDEFGMTRQIVKDVHSVTGCMFALEVLRRELDNSLLSVLELDEFGKMNYAQFKAIVSDGVLALSQLDLAEGQAEQVVKAVNKVRKMAKAVNFLICYLGTASTLAGNIGIPKAFAEQIMSAVFKSYGRLAPWQEETIATARKQGYVTTAFGTWKHVSSDILSRENGKRSRAERQAVNQTIQGCAADILKVVLSGAERQGIFHDPAKASMYAPVYDEIVSSVHMDYCFEYVEKMQDLMNLTPPGHAIPMMGEVSIGMNWCDQVELGDRPAERKLINLFEDWVKEAA